MSTDFEAATLPLRRELLAHCYRMMGSAVDAEDQVQETYLRAWRAFHDFGGRSSVRTWMYPIATNSCLNALSSASKRVLPSGLGTGHGDPRAPISPLAGGGLVGAAAGCGALAESGTYP